MTMQFPRVRRSALHSIRSLSLAAMVLALAACGRGEPEQPMEVRAPAPPIAQIPIQDMMNCAQEQAPLIDNLGEYRRHIGAAAEMTQYYFDQGLLLTYGRSEEHTSELQSRPHL